MPIPSVSFNGGYYNSSNYDWARPGSQTIIINSAPIVPAQPARKKSGGSVVGTVATVTVGTALLTTVLAVLQRRFKFLPKDSNCDKGANWLTEKLSGWAQKGQTKLSTKYPDGKADNGKVVEWSKKALGNIAEFFKKEGKC